MSGDNTEIYHEHGLCCSSAKYSKKNKSKYLNKIQCIFPACALLCNYMYNNIIGGYEGRNFGICFYIFTILLM